MSDLISRKALMDVFQEKADDNSGLLRNNMLFAKELVKSIPTAYDVDKVVEQIEKLPHRKLNLGDLMMDIMESKKTDRHFICLEDVIAIVKGAVKDESSNIIR